MKALPLSLACLTALLACQAQASSPDAWATFDKQVRASCIKASQLKNVKVQGNAAQFDDRVGYSALLLQGQYPQKHMKARPAWNCACTTSSARAPMSPNGIRSAPPSRPRAGDWRITCFESAI